MILDLYILNNYKTNKISINLLCEEITKKQSPAFLNSLLLPQLIFLFTTSQ